MSYHERHRIYPDVEAPAPSAPAAPPALQKKIHHDDQYEKFEEIPIQEQPLFSAGASAPPAPAPLPPPKKSKRRRGCCYKCFCWTLLTIVLLIVVIGAVIGILYLIYRPKIPQYSVDRLTVTNFTIANTTASANFDVQVTATNNNKKIGIYYKEGSSLKAWYKDRLLASGSLPVFYQGYRNTTVFNVVLSGETELDNGLLSEFQQDQQSGQIPLTFHGDVPVRVKFGVLKFWKVTIKVRCTLVVNSLESTSDISIRSSSCKFSKLKLFG